MRATLVRGTAIQKGVTVNKRVRYLVMGTGLATLVFVMMACGSTDLGPVEGRIGSVEQSVSALQSQLASLEAGAGTIGAPVGVKHFYVTGVEWKGSTSAAGLAPPTIDPATLSDGYGFKAQDVYEPENDKWQVASYVFTPGAMVAYEGDRIDMTFFIINGNKHTVWVEAPDGATALDEVEMNRGREYDISFTASAAGVYNLICTEHEPTMTARILVLPRS